MFPLIIGGVVFVVVWFVMFRYLDLFWVFFNPKQTYTGEQYYYEQSLIYMAINGCLNVIYEVSIAMIYAQSCFIAPLIMLAARIYQVVVLTNAPEHQYVENVFYTELNT